MNGIIVVNKPSGMTSRDVVNKLSKILNTKKIGHTGTLDPIADGVLVCLIGKYTKLSNYITSETKEYIASFDIGYETDTLDSTGNTINKGKTDIDEADLSKTINSMNITYDQEVPIYSAVKIDGHKLYEYARNNKEVNLPKRSVTIFNIEYLGNHSFKCLVSKGTYIRSLIRDIGYKLDSYMTMTSLTRTKQGIFDINDSYTLDDIRDGKYKLLSAKDIYRTIDIDKNVYNIVSNGGKVKLDCEDDVVALKYNDNIVCLYKKDNEIYRMLIKF